MEKTAPLKNRDADKPYLSQNNFNDWMKNPALVRTWHHDRAKMPKPDPEVQKLFDFGHLMHKKAQELYPDGFEDTRKLRYNEHLENSLKLLEKRIPLFELGFQHDNLYARPDIMIPSGDDAWNMIEVKSTPKMFDNDVKYVAFLYYVIVKCGIKIDKCYLMLLKKGIYARPEMPAEAIFEKTDITSRIIELQEYIQYAIAEMREAATQ